MGPLFSFFPGGREVGYFLIGYLSSRVRREEGRPRKIVFAGTASACALFAKLCIRFIFIFSVNYDSVIEKCKEKQATIS